MSGLKYEEISELAKQAGLSDGLFIVKNVSSDAVHLFAELVAATEREECAKICELEDPTPDAYSPDWEYTASRVAKECARNIRDRGNKINK